VPPAPAYLGLAALLALGVSGAAWRARALSASGAGAAAFVGFCLFGFAGGRGAAALLLFFVTSSALSRVGKRRKDALAFEKGGERDAGQVLANGGVAALCAAALPFVGPGSRPVVLAALLGALATANADTWATELGALARRPPVMLTTFKPAPTGASGAVSGPGTLAALAGALLIGAAALLWRPELGQSLVPAMGAATVGGFLGALFDSLLGATVQVQYRCAVCGKLTERHEHCGQPTEYARGVRWLNNDAVNTLATLAGAAFAAGLYAVLASGR
jgi:uncharacterized protein (TIGR00297 family)